MFLVLRWVTVKLCGGPVGTREEQGENDVYIAQCSKVNRKVFLGDIKCPGVTVPQVKENEMQLT